ncbi:hypothetical protein K7X08_024464 [Anisodus acutangulus]|uniref:Uncharacterized protein n=1 Tax=Anisodus acutangulus TaxID=402998 RepID=A0A9Q1M8F3_9SOLA|nr:hypothetical protein K7X08_024464 [Anisodus acutangulus]
MTVAATTKHVRKTTLNSGEPTMADVPATWRRKRWRRRPDLSHRHSHHHHQQPSSSSSHLDVSPPPSATKTPLPLLLISSSSLLHQQHHPRRPSPSIAVVELAFDDSSEQQTVTSKSKAIETNLGLETVYCFFIFSIYFFL